MSQGNSARIYLREDRSESYSKKIPKNFPPFGRRVAVCALLQSQRRLLRSTPPGPHKFRKSPRSIRIRRVIEI